MIGTYYTTEDGFRSALVLNNKGPNQIMVTPILHSKAGQTFTASPVTVDGESSREVDMNKLVSIAGPQFLSGSFEFTYEGRKLEMGGGLRVINAEKSLIFDEQMLEPGMKFPSSRLEAVYAVPFRDSHMSVIVTNTTAQPITVTGDAIFAGAISPHPIQSDLGPYEMQVVNLPRGQVKKSLAGAVSLNHNGDKGALLAMIHIQDADRGYSTAVNFINPGGKTTERHGAGLRLGSVNNDPLRAVIAVRNIGESATTVTATVPYSKQNGDTGTISLPQVSLAPGEIKLLNTSNPQLRQNDFATAGLEIKYTGAPGSVIATASSVSQSGNHVFALPMKDPKGGLSSTGGYPWFINETSSTVVFIKNTTDEPQYFHLDLVPSNSERWGSNLRLLAPHQTFVLDVKKIRDSQEKGVKGNALPPDATIGHVFWSVRGNPKTLIGRAQTMDFRNGLSSTYECQCNCGMSFTDAVLEPGGASEFPGYTEQFLAREQDTNCFTGQQSWYDVPAHMVSFNVDNPSVSQINSFGLMTALAPGQTFVRASWNTVGIIHKDANGECWIESATADTEAFCEVQTPDFTVAHDKQQTGIRPSGIIAGVNGADPPIPVSDTQATVTVSTNPPTSGQNVTLSVVATEEGEFDAGGHVNHTGVRPVGTLSQSSGTTGSDGTFTAVYTAPIFGGGHSIRATMNGVTKEVGIGVFINGLSLLGEGTNYDLVGETNTHPINHFGTATAVAGLPLIADNYMALFPGSAPLRFNDISLSFGGKFEIAGNWGNGSHAEHRVGRNCDISSSNVPTNRWATINQIFLNNNVVSVNDETACCTHWHVRFRP